MSCYMEECSSGLKSYKWKKKKKKQTATNQKCKTNHKPQQNKNQTTTPKTANKETFANAALLITSLQTHPEYMLCFYILAIKVCRFTEELALRSGDGFVQSIATVLMFFLWGKCK